MDLGVGAGTVVSIHMEDTTSLIVTLISILFALTAIRGAAGARPPTGRAKTAAAMELTPTVLV
jgi:hypothetical protein